MTNSSKKKNKNRNSNSGATPSSDSKNPVIRTDEVIPEGKGTPTDIVGEKENKEEEKFLQDNEERSIQNFRTTFGSEIEYQTANTTPTKSPAKKDGSQEKKKEVIEEKKESISNEAILLNILLEKVQGMQDEVGGLKDDLKNVNDNVGGLRIQYRSMDEVQHLIIQEMQHPNSTGIRASLDPAEMEDKQEEDVAYVAE